MKHTLHYRFKGIDMTEDFDSPTDALDEGVRHLHAKSGCPMKVTNEQGRELISQADMFLAWETEVREKDSPIK